MNAPGGAGSGAGGWSAAPNVGGKIATPEGGAAGEGPILVSGGTPPAPNGGATGIGGSATGGAAVSTGGASSGGTTPSDGGSSGSASSSGASSPSDGGSSSGASSGGTAPSDGGSSGSGSSSGATSPSDGGSSSGASSGGAADSGGAPLAGSFSLGGTTGTATPLDSYERTLGPIALEGISNASGIAWKPETDTFFVVSNGNHVLYEFPRDFETQLRAISLDNGATDTEDVAYLGGNRFAVVDEENQVYVVTIPDGTTSVDLSGPDAERYVVSAPPATMNRGLEGVTLNPGTGDTGQFIVCQEGGVTGVPIRVLFFERHTGAGTFSYADGSLVVEEPWNALDQLGSVATDLAAVSFDVSSSTLLVLGQETSRLLRVLPKTGDLLDQRDLSGSPQYEGVTLADGGRLVLISEPNFVEVYQSS